MKDRTTLGRPRVRELVGNTSEWKSLRLMRQMVWEEKGWRVDWEKPASDTGVRTPHGISSRLCPSSRNESFIFRKLVASR